MEQNVSEDSELPCQRPRSVIRWFLADGKRYVHTLFLDDDSVVLSTRGYDDVVIEIAKYTFDSRVEILIKSPMLDKFSQDGLFGRIKMEGVCKDARWVFCRSISVPSSDPATSLERIEGESYRGPEAHLNLEVRVSEHILALMKAVGIEI